MTEKEATTMVTQLSNPDNPTKPGSSIVANPDVVRSSGLMSRVNQSALIWVLVLVAIPASRLASSSFPSMELVNSMITLGLFLAVVAFGQGLVILTGGIDLSVPAVVALGAFSTGYLSSAGLPAMAALLLGVLVASAVGVINGLIIAGTTFPPFIVTLAMSSIAAALLLGFSKQAQGQEAPPELVSIFARSSTLAGIPLSVFIFVIVIVIGYLIQSRTRYGRSLYAIGNSPQAARIAGVKVKLNLVLTYWIASVSYGLAGALLLGYGSGSDLNIGAAWLLPSIAAIVVGGASISGGTGSYLGTVGAALFLTVLGIDISAAGFSEGVKQVLYGAVIFIALLLSKLGVARR